MKLESNRKIIYRLVLLLYFTVIGYSSCTYQKEQISPQDVCTDALPDSVIFNKNILPILISNCAMTGCHSNSNPAGNLDLSAGNAYSQLSKKGSGYINVSNPNYSILYSTLISVSSPMPPSGSLSSCDLQLIKNWMSQGGKNN
jgi:hypothetical protein